MRSNSLILHFIRYFFFPFVFKGLSGLLRQDEIVGTLRGFVWRLKGVTYFLCWWRNYFSGKLGGMIVRLQTIYFMFTRRLTKSTVAFIHNVDETR